LTVNSSQLTFVPTSKSCDTRTIQNIKNSTGSNLRILCEIFFYSTKPRLMYSPVPFTWADVDDTRLLCIAGVMAINPGRTVTQHTAHSTLATITTKQTDRQTDRQLIMSTTPPATNKYSTNEPHNKSLEFRNCDKYKRCHQLSWLEIQFSQCFRIFI